VEGVEKTDSEWDQTFTSDVSQTNDTASRGDESEDAVEDAPPLPVSETNGVSSLPSSSGISPGVDISDACQHSDDVQRESLREVFGSDFNFEDEQQHYFLDPDGEVLEPPSLRIVPVELPPEVVEPAVAVEEDGREPEHDLRRDDEDEDEEEPDEDVDEELWNDDDAHWDGIEVQEVAVGQEQNVEGVPAAPDPNPGPGARRGDQNVAVAANAELPPDVADDLEGNVEDDMEGAMEGLWLLCFPLSLVLTITLAIGMRGPIYSVFQNVSHCRNFNENSLTFY
jgi:E3 ubiquitin-protein ligase MARCH6